MKLNVAVQMDPIARINIRGDSTFALLLEAQKRGHGLSYYTPGQALAARRGTGGAGAGADRARRARRSFHARRAAARAAGAISTSSCCGRTRRSISPTSPRRISSSGIHPKTLVVNNPASVRNAPEKIFVMDFPHLMPPTLISRDLDEINAFRDEHGAVVMKPLHGHGGAAVFRVMPQDMNFGSLFDMFSVTFREPWVIQRFLPEVKHGDKRIILVDGEFAGAVNRVPAPDDLRSNMVRGGAAQATDLSDARARNLRDARPRAARARLVVRRHRRDRRQSHRDQRDLADRHPRHRAARRAGCGGEDLGRDREEAGMSKGLEFSRSRRGPFFTPSLQRCSPASALPFDTSTDPIVTHAARDSWHMWLDQSEYMRSALAFSSLSLASSEHRYPPLYALLAAPFTRLLPNDPFLVVDLISVCTCVYLLTILFRRDCGPVVAAVLGVLLLVGNRLIAEAFIVPGPLHRRCPGTGIARDAAMGG